MIYSSKFFIVSDTTKYSLLKGWVSLLVLQLRRPVENKEAGILGLKETFVINCSYSR